MNLTHLHLLLNHFPVIGTLIGSGLLIWGIVKKQNNIRAVAAVLLALMALIAIPVFLTGEPAEESVEKLAGVSESMIKLHEDAATIAIWMMVATGIIALLSLFFQWQKKQAANRLFTLAFVLSVICFAAMARTGYYGGQIRHTELSSGNTGNVQTDIQGGKNNQPEKDDD